MSSERITSAAEYVDWLLSVKTRFRQVQLKAAITVNTTLLQFYWELGADIVARQAGSQWGQGFLKQVSIDLIQEFPEVKGFSASNLKYIRQWYTFYAGSQSIGQQAVDQIVPQPIEQFFNIPWGHHLAILAKCKRYDEALYYVQATQAHGWSRSVLVHQIESRLYQREGHAISNFEAALPAPLSDLARQTLKDPYLFDFLSLTKEHTERELELSLIQHISQFLLELGTGFAYIGRQVPIQVGEREFFLDLLFYHTRLHCYVVVELKTVDFEPEHAGKLNFYLKAVDEQLRGTGDAPSIGLLLCKNRDRLVAEYALSDVHKPMGIASYELTHTLPLELQDKLPSIERLEQELGLDESTGDGAADGAAD
jgi:predicted nuclease of restriction endonuclease-like (RecB) superfamily